MDKKIVNKKPSNPVEVLRRKIDALCVRLQLKGVGLKGKVEAQKIEISIKGILISGSVRRSRDFQAKGFNAWITRTSKKLKIRQKPNAAQFFLARLLVLLTGWSFFYFRAVDLIVGLAINSAMFMASKVAVSLSR